MQLTRTAIILLFAVAVPTAAEAYPTFQFTSGVNRCGMCHYAPSGGALINSFGRRMAGTTLSQFGGNGEVFHGLYEEPGWFKLGGDYRGMVLGRRSPNDTGGELTAFPMQFDVYGLFRIGRSFSVYSELGVRGQVRGEAHGIPKRLVSYEHWVMWKPKPTGAYARLGRFFAPFGLRTQDHTAFVRRYLGFHTQEESYGLTGGYIANDWEAHITAHAPVPDALAGSGPGSWGGTAYYERRFDDMPLAVGGQARVAVTSDDQRYIAGGIAKYHLEAARLLLMGELDFIVQAFDAGDSPARSQLAAYLSSTFTPVQGVSVTAALETYHDNLAAGGTMRDAVSLGLQYFPYAHFEFQLIGKLEFVGDLGSDDNPAAQLLLFQWHYYL